jgi:hypothetical protein
VLSSLDGAVDLEEAVRAAIAAHGHDATSRAAARFSRSSSSRLWKSAYARSTDRFDALSRFLNGNPNVMEVVLASQRERRDRDRGQDLVLGWVLNLMARYQLATDWDSSDWLVIDEGFCQRAVALFGHGFAAEDDAHLGLYLDSIPLPEAVVLVDTPLDVCGERLDTRGWSARVEGLPAADRLRFLETSAQVVESVAQHLQEQGIRLVRVDSTTPPSVTTTTVRDFLVG